MRFLLDNTLNRGSEADSSLPKYGGDVFGRGIDPEVPVTDDPVQDAQFNNPTTPSVAPESSEQKDKKRLIEEAKRLMRKGSANVPGRLAERVGAPSNVVNALNQDSPQARQEVKDYAKQKTRDFAKDRIGKKIANQGIKQGFEKGLEKGAGAAIKQGGKKAIQSAGKSAGKAVAKGAAKGAAQAGTKVGAKAGTMAAVEGGIAAAGVATGAATFGLGFILSMLLDIAISLGINDAVDAAFELKEGNVKQATFLAIRAGTKVGIFIWFLIGLVLMFSVAGIFFAIPILVVLNIYMILGSIPALDGIPHLQGMVWWEKLILIAIDIIAFLILVAFIGGLVYYLCETSGLGGGGVTGAITGAAASVYDWWSGGTSASFANDICKQVMTPVSGG